MLNYNKFFFIVILFAILYLLKMIVNSNLFEFFEKKNKKPIFHYITSKDRGFNI